MLFDQALDLLLAGIGAGILVLDRHHHAGDTGCGLPDGLAVDRAGDIHAALANENAYPDVSFFQLSILLLRQALRRQVVKVHYLHPGVLAVA